MTVYQNDVLRVAARFKHPTFGDLVNVYHFRMTGVAGVDDSEAISDVATLVDDMHGEMVAYTHSTYAAYDINVFNVTQDRPLGSVAWPTVSGGAAGGEVMPSQVAAYVQGNTGFSRSWARKFLGGMAETYNVNGRVGSTLLTALTSYAAKWIAAVPPSTPYTTWEAVVYSSKVAQWRKITEAVIRDVWSTIRRRRVGRGS